MLHKNKFAFYILSIRLISYVVATGYGLYDVVSRLIPFESATALLKPFPAFNYAVIDPDGKKP